MPSRSIPISNYPNFPWLLSTRMFWLHMDSPQLFLLSLPWWLSDLFDSMLRLTSQIFISLMKYFEYPSRKLHILNYHQSPSEGHYCCSPFLFSNNLIYHSNFHYHKSRIEHTQKKNLGRFSKVIKKMHIWLHKYKQTYPTFVNMISQLSFILSATWITNTPEYSIYL